MQVQLPPTPISPYLPLPVSPPSRSDNSQDDGSTNTDEDDDLFPATSAPLTRPSDPRMVPLPPSPTIKPSLPHRKPKGWVSSLPSSRDSSATFVDDLPHRAPISLARRDSQSTRVRSVSARPPSGSSPMIIGGRTISGAMQYAMHPDISTGVEEYVGGISSHVRSRSDGIRFDQTDLFDPTSGVGDSSNDSQSEIGDASCIETSHQNEGDFSMEEIQNSVVGLTDQDQDEVWMQYVRNQLGTLFPDFFNEPVEEGDHVGTGGENVGWAMVQDGAHRRPMTFAPVADEGQRGDVPNVREELHGLRDEIERLRGVVGGLAEGLHREGVLQHSEGAIIEEIADDNGASQSDLAEVGEGEKEDLALVTNLQPVPQAFVLTAHLSVEIIRSLDLILIPRDGSTNDAVLGDDRLFSEANLVRLKEQLVLQLGIPTPDSQ